MAGWIYFGIYLSVGKLHPHYRNSIFSKFIANPAGRIPHVVQIITMPKATTPVAAARQVRRHNPLEDDLTATGLLKNKPGKRKSRHEDEEEKFVDSKASRKILRIAQELAEDDENEENNKQGQKVNSAFDFSSRFDHPEEETYEDDGEVWGDEDEIIEEVELDPNDQETFNKFFPTKEDPLLRTGWGGRDDEPQEGQTTNLAALILEKIDAFEAAQARAAGGQDPGPVDDEFQIPPKVVEVYTQYVPLACSEVLLLVSNCPR